MATIGIFGGMGPQASNKLCELIISKSLDRSVSRKDIDVPEIVLLSVPVPNFVSNKHNMKIAKEMLLNRVKLFERSKCDIAGIACNTAHLLLPDIQAATTVEFVSLPHLVADRLCILQSKRTGLLASPTTLRSTLFDDAIQGTVLIRPSMKLVNLTERNIRKKLANTLTKADMVIFKEAIQIFMVTEKLDTTILGCTELPLVFGESNDPRIIDTLDVLSDALLERSRAVS